MKLKHIDRIVSAVAVALWMAVIFWFSAQNGQSSGSMSAGITQAVARFLTPGFDSLSPLAQAEVVEALHLFVRKAAHFSEYAVLGVLTANALRTYRLKHGLRFLLPVSVCFLYAVSDEFHQSFVVGRAGRLSDVLLDTAGAVTGVAVFLAARYVLRKIKNRGKHDDTQASAE